MRNEIDEKFVEVYKTLKEGLTGIVRKDLMENCPRMLRKYIEIEVNKIMNGNDISMGLIEKLITEVISDPEKVKQAYQILALKFPTVDYWALKLNQKEWTFQR